MILLNGFFCNFSHDSNCIRFIIFVVPNPYAKLIKNIQQMFNNFWLRILHFIHFMQHNSLKLELHYFLTNVLRPIFFIITSKKNTSLRGSGKKSFQANFIWCLVHIRLPLVHQCRMVNILSSLLYVMFEKKTPFFYRTLMQIQ